MTRSLFAVPVLLGLTAALAQNTVQGAGPLAGGDAALGRTYTLYLGTGDALNFTLNRVEYLSGRFITDPGTAAERDYLREAGKKLVALHYSVQNPQTRNYNFRADYSLKVTGVDSNNKEVTRTRGSMAYDEITRKTASMTLKPAQKINVISILELDSRASLPKLLVETNKATGAVWRYNLQGKVAALPGPFRDPRVPDGSAALDQGIALKPGEYVPAKELDFKVTDVRYSTADTLDRKVPPGGKIMVVTLTYRNPHFRPFKLGNAFPPVRLKVFDQDGIAGGDVGKQHFASRDQPLDGELGMNGEIGARIAVALPAGLTPQRLEFSEANKRTFTLDLSGVK